MNKSDRYSPEMRLAQEQRGATRRPGSLHGLGYAEHGVDKSAQDNVQQVTCVLNKTAMRGKPEATLVQPETRSATNGTRLCAGARLCKRRCCGCAS
jgi:hypothetical protein